MSFKAWYQTLEASMSSFAKLSWLTNLCTKRAKKKGRFWYTKAWNFIYVPSFSVEWSESHDLVETRVKNL